MTALMGGMSTASYILCSLLPSQDLILTVAKAALWELRA